MSAYKRARMVKGSIWDVWVLRGEWHRYYGPCSSFGCWCIHGRFVK